MFKRIDVLKILLSLTVLVTAWQVGKRVPSLGGLIAVMPLTGLMVMLLIYSEHSGDTEFMLQFVKGILWGIVPSILFFITAYFCFREKMTLWLVLTVSFGVWLLGAIVHQLLLKK